MELIRACLLFVVGGLLCAPELLAQEDAPLSIPELEALVAEREAVSDPTESLALELDSYRQALAHQRIAQSSDEQAQAYSQEALDAPGLIASIREDLARDLDGDEDDRFDELELEELESLSRQAQAQLETARSTLVEADQLIERRNARRASIPEEVATRQAELALAEEALSALEEGPGREPRRTLLLSQVAELKAVLRMLEAERALHEATKELLPLRRDRASREVARLEARVGELARLVASRRAAEGDAAAEAVGQLIDDVTKRFPILEQLAERNRELADVRAGEGGLPRRIAQAEQELEEDAETSEETSRRFRSARRRVAAGGLTEGMAGTLRHDLEWLATEGELKRERKTREALLSDAQLELIAAEEQRAELGDTATATKRLLTQLGFDESDTEIEAEVRRLVTKQRELQDAALEDLSTLISVYYEHKRVSGELATQAQAYREYIGKRILFVRSTSLDPSKTLFHAPGDLGDVGVQLYEDFDASRVALVPKGQAVKSALLWLVLITLVVGRARWKRLRREAAVEVRSYRTDAFGHTLKALLWSLLLAGPLPLLAWLVGWALAESELETWSQFGHVLRELALPWLVIRFLRGLCGAEGVGQSHFKWPAPSCAVVAKELRWFEPLLLVFGFGFLFLDRLRIQEWSDSVGRVCFAIVMVGLAVVLHRLLRQHSRLWAIQPKTGHGLLGRTHRVWSFVASGLPASLAVVALLGYYYTALQLELRLRYSIALALGLVLANALLLRWLFMARRRLAVQQALEARDRRQEAEPREGTEGSATPLDADKVDIPSIDAQTRQLFKSSVTFATIVGLYLVWASVLPALQGLDRVQILPRVALLPAEPELAYFESLDSSTVSGGVVEVDAPTTDPGASVEAPSTFGLPGSLTLDDLLIAIVLAFLTFVATKNVPALLELAILRRLPLDAGSRYAASTVVRYLILVMGAGAVSRTIGVGWQEVQWLAAALTFGLGFGLQEIFANFVSGLIILLERPVRVGDIVTVAGVEGKVTELRMRATMIQDWERRELLVPNKEFITGSVVNWTLTDPITRVVVPVGIAYGSDVDLTKRLLMDCARDISSVLADPSPQVVFRRFGDSSLDFELRVFLASREYWPSLVDQLNTMIDDRFRAAGIEIPFPQRDVHLHGVVESGAATLKDGGRPS